MQQPDLLGILQQNIFNGKYHSGKQNCFHGEITVLPFTCCGWFFFFIFGQSNKKQHILRRFPSGDVLGKKDFQQGRNLTVFNLELDCFIKGIM